MRKSQNGSMSSGGGQAETTLLTPHEQRLYSFFLSGGEWSAKQLMSKVPNRDPRSTIRYIRNKGYSISDKWVTDGITRWKLYFVHL
jgi:hypothetical protein